MPITVKASDGIIEPGAEAQLFAALMDSFLRINGVAGNPFITPNLIGDLQIIPTGSSFAGGERDDYVVVGLKVPSFSLALPSQKQAFIDEATEAVLRASKGNLRKDRVFVNMVYGDGFWGIGGTLYIDETLQMAIKDAGARRDAELLAQLNSDYLNSDQASDVDRYEEILADDFTASLPDLMLYDRQEFLAMIALPRPFTELQAHDVQIRLLGDLALIHARITFRSLDGVQRQGRYTDDWQRRDGKWLCVAANVIAEGM